MFVSRKNLPFIHLVPTEAPPCLYMLQSLHQSVELLRAAASCCKLFQPFAEHSIECLMLRFGQKARLLNQLLICTEGNVFQHESSVHDLRATSTPPPLLRPPSGKSGRPLCPALLLESTPLACSVIVYNGGRNCKALTLEGHGDRH